MLALALLAVLSVFPTTRAVFPQSDPSRVVPTILFGRIVPLLTLGAS